MRTMPLLLGAALTVAVPLGLAASPVANAMELCPKKVKLRPEMPGDSPVYTTSNATSVRVGQLDKSGSLPLVRKNAGCTAVKGGEYRYDNGKASGISDRWAPVSFKGKVRYVPYAHVRFV